VKHSFEQSIPTNRIVLYSIIASLLPVFFAILWAQSSISAAETNRATLLDIGEKLQKKSAAQDKNRQILLQFRGKDPLFLHRRIEPMPLLSTETSILRSRLARSALPDDIQLEKRLNSLSSENSFCFVEGSTDVAPMYKETIENQNKTVEVNTQDLVEILTILESQDEKDDSQKPHLIISEARIERKKGFFQETWALMLKVLRREYS
jgi:hypothetical protein